MYLPEEWIIQMLLWLYRLHKNSFPSGTGCHFSIRSFLILYIYKDFMSLTNWRLELGWPCIKLLCIWKFMCWHLFFDQSWHLALFHLLNEQLGLPADREQYIHRLGRTGRKGKEGQGIVLLAPWEEFFLSTVKDLPITKAPIPSVDPDTKKKVYMMAYSDAFGWYMNGMSMKLNQDYGVTGGKGTIPCGDEAQRSSISGLAWLL